MVRKNYSKFFETVNKAKNRTPGNLTSKPSNKYFKNKKNSKKYPKVSIITYVYCTRSNKRWFQLFENINSIKSQKYPNYEHIIVDDGSTIHLSKKINSLKNPHIKYYRKENTGITKSTKTFNYGFRVMTGKYGMILSSDDVHLPGTIHRLVSYMESHNNWAAVTGNIIHQRLNLQGKLISERKIIRRESGTIKNELMKKNCVNGCATMFRKSFLDKIKLPPDITGFAADYDLWMKLSEIGPIMRIPDIVIKYRNFGNATRIITMKQKKYREKCIGYVKRTALERRRKK